MARPRKQIDPRRVEALAAEGCTAAEIGAVLNVGSATIERRFDGAVQNGHRKLGRFLKRELVKQAKKGSLGAIIFGLKAYCGLRETDPVSINVAANAVTTFGLDDAQRKQIERLAQQIQYRAFHRQQPEPVTNGNGNADNTTAALN